MEIPRELIEQFLRVTNATEPLANQLLMDSGLDLDAAISSFFAIQEAGGVPDIVPEPPIPTPSAANAPPPLRAPASVDADAAFARALAAQDRRSAPMDMDADGVRAPIPQRIDRLIPNAAPRRSQAVYDPFIAPDDPNRDNPLAAMFRPPAHLIFQGSLDEAMAAGRRLNRWVLVTIHQTEVFACHVLNRDVWSDQYVQELLENSFVFWQRDAASDDGRRYNQFYRYSTDPHIAVIDPRSGERVVVWSPPTHRLGRDEVLRYLTEFIATQSLENQSPIRRAPPGASSAPRPAGPPRPAMDEAADIAETEDAQLAAAIAASMAYSGGEDGVEPAGIDVPNGRSYAAVAGRDEDGARPNSLRDLSRQRSATDPTLNRDRSLRAQQDSEYEASLALDRAKAESVREEEERVRRAQQLRDAKRARVPPEPPAGTAGTAELMIRLPDNKRLQRRFFATDTIGVVYDYVEVESDTVEDTYDLMTPYPKQTLRDRAVSIAQAGLCPKAVLVVHIR